MSSKKKKKSTSKNGHTPTTSKKKKKRKRVKIETDCKSKQQRRKILEVRSMQTRFADLEPIHNTDDATAIAMETSTLIELSESQETAISALELRFREYDEDYYGFIEYDKFLSILKQHKIQLSHKQETYLVIALTLIEDGVDYNGFLAVLTAKANALPNSNLTKICQQIAIEAEQKRSINEESKQAPIEVDEDEVNKFYDAAQNARSRGMSLAQMDHTSMVIPSTNKIRQVIEEFALDGVEVDFAIFKTALAAIDCNPNDEDLIFLINYLHHDSAPGKEGKEREVEDTMDDDDLFVDFNYFISFCQEVINVPVMLWSDPEKVIEKVAKQTRMARRTQQRRHMDRIKIKKRLENRKKSKNEKNKRNEELKQIEAEEKRLRALKLRDKAKMVSAPKRGEEKLKLREWISKRGKTRSKKAQHELKKWMQTNNVFQKHLYNELSRNGITSMDALKQTNRVQMDQILRKVRNDRFAEVKSMASRNKMDKLLVNFEKQWKKVANVKKGSAKRKKSSKRKK